jgi:hypothetical protein
MDKNAIAKNIRLLALNGRELIENIIMCKVVSVSGVTCVCQPIDEGLSEILDVRLVTESSSTNFIIEPSIGSVVAVMPFSDIDNCEYIVVMFSEVETIKIRGDQHNGLVKVAELVDKLNAIEESINDLKQIFSLTWIPTPNDGGAALKAAAASWAATQITETQKLDIENVNVKHG